MKFIDGTKYSFNHKIQHLLITGKRYPGQLPPRNMKIIPKRIQNIPKLEDEEWKKIRSRRKRTILVAPYIHVSAPVD